MCVSSTRVKPSSDQVASQAMRRRSPVTESVASDTMDPPVGPASLRHSFGTHAAMFGVNPWRLQAWMGHKRIDETHLYVHMAGEHMRPLPPEFVEAAAREIDPDRRIVLMSASRANKMPTAQPPRQESAGLLGA
jgi:integrase